MQIHLIVHIDPSDPQWFFVGHGCFSLLQSGSPYGTDKFDISDKAKNTILRYSVNDVLKTH